MKKIDVSSATPEQLDWLILQLERKETKPDGSVWLIEHRCRAEYFVPTESTCQMGEIMRRERISLRVDTRGGRWVAFYDHGAEITGRSVDSDMLRAAARCYVSNHFGPKTVVPEEL